MMGFVDEWIELLMIMVIVGVFFAMGGIIFNQYLDKAHLTLSVAALNKAQKTLKEYKATHRSFPASLDFSNCSDQDHHVVLNCDEIKADIHSFVSYAGTAEKFDLTAKAKDSQVTLIKVTESTISF